MASRQKLVRGHQYYDNGIFVYLWLSFFVAGGIAGSTSFPLTNSTRQRCFDIVVGIMNTLIEGNKFHTASLMSGSIMVQFSRRSSSVEIIDPNGRLQESKSIGLFWYYRVLSSGINSFIQEYLDNFVGLVPETHSVYSLFLF